jgi:hypothetical protein
MDVEVAAGAGVGREVVVVSRDVWPPLRRWAAARLVRRDPDRWRGLLDAAEVLSSRDAAALTAGIMDAAEHIPNDDRAVAVAVGLDSGSGIVRLAALPAFAVLEGPVEFGPTGFLGRRRGFYAASSDNSARRTRAVCIGS